MIFKTGDRVRIKYGGGTCDGTIALASRNGKSLMLMFQAMLGGYVGMMPVLEVNGTFQDLIEGRPVDIFAVTTSAQEHIA